MDRREQEDVLGTVVPLERQEPRGRWDYSETLVALDQLEARVPRE